MNNQTKGRLILLTIAAAFAVPIVVAAYLYFSSTGWRPPETTQYGTLVQPSISLPETPLNAAPDATAFREVWSMVVINEGSCADNCQAALVKIRQIRLALGPKMTRMQTVYLSPDAAPLTSAVLAEHPRLIVGDAAISAAVSSALGDYNTGEILLVDPFGNLMMRYPNDAEMSGIRKDLGKLLKLSTIG